MKPPAPRARVTDTVDRQGRRERTVTIPAPRRWYFTVFYALWLLIWIPAGITFLFKLINGGVNPPPGFPFFVPMWLVGWFVCGSWVLLSWLWVTFGQEEVRFVGDELVLERRVFRLRWTRAFDRAAVSFLRVSPTPTPWWERGSAHNNLHPFQNRSCLAFDYGSATVRFGSGIDEAEAFDIMDELNRVLER